MGRLIIDNRSSVSDADVLGYVQAIIRDGRISNYGKQYCYHTLVRGVGLSISTDLNKASDRFVILDTKAT